jgi:hypothetical protein
MPTKRIELTGAIDGEPMLSVDALSLLFGNDADTISDQMTNHLATNGTGPVQFPPEWIKAGKRRSKEAAAAIGSNDVFDILDHWARRDLGATVVFQDSDQ